jgi:5-methylcytosine-specific restriction endonuclease McrBC regulatory subunit McrC
LVFPRDWGYYGDDVGEGQIISFHDDCISTGNIMGFVGVNNTQVDIVSRFTKTDGEDYFLHYMLQRVFAINLFDIKHTLSRQPIFDFLLYLFPFFLKKALRQGLYKKYKRFEYNDSNIRGPIDINRHIRENIPFRGTVAYSTREHTYDNEVTELIRHTIEYIKIHPMGNGVLNCDQETKNAVMTVMQATPSYNSRDRNRILNLNLRPVTHPYYSEYTSLQKICVQILRHEALKYGQEKDRIYGVLFDGAWLWEEYLGTIFAKARLDITHAKNKTGENGIPIYNGSKRYYPDFYRRNDCVEKSFVLDAKYKRLGFEVKADGQEDEKTNTIAIGREDLFQMITYMHVLPARNCALLYPIEPYESNTSAIVPSSPRQLHGDGGEIIGIGIPIVNEAEFSKYCDSQGIIEKQLVVEIKKWM